MPKYRSAPPRFVPAPLPLTLSTDAHLSGVSVTAKSAMTFSTIPTSLSCLTQFLLKPDLIPDFNSQFPGFLQL